MKALLQQLVSAGVRFQVGASGEVTAKVPSELSAELKQQFIAHKDGIKAIVLTMSQRGHGISAAPDLPAYPLSPAQRQIWLMSLLQSDHGQYHMPAHYQITGHFDPCLANQVFRKLLLKHPVLRSTVVENDYGVWQQIRPLGEFRVEISDLSSDSADIARHTLANIKQEMFTKPFRLTDDLPFRVHWVRVAENSSFLFMTVHHIACDGWSLDLLLRQFQQLYTNNNDCQTPTDIAYHDYAYWLSQPAQLEQALAEEQYWSEQLTALPTYHHLTESKQKVSASSARWQGELTAELASSVYKVASSHAMTPFMLMHACFALMAAKVGNQPDVVVGAPSNNRGLEQLQNVVGLFLSTQVLRLNTEQPTFISYLDHVRAVHQQAHLHQRVSLERLIELHSESRNHLHSPMFQIFLNTQNVTADRRAFDGSFSLGDTKLIELAAYCTEQELIFAKYDIDLTFSFSENKIVFDWVYKTDLFTQEQIMQMQQYLHTIIIQVVELSVHREYHRWRSISLMTTQQQQAILNKAPVIMAEEPVRLSVSRQFEQAAQQWPDRIAYRHNTQSVTYKQLNERANQLARYLQSAGVQAGSRVGICLPRSFLSVIGVLAILKCRAAFIPMEVTYPAARLKLIMDDAHPELMLTDMKSSLTLVGYDVRILQLDSAETEAEITGFNDQNLQNEPCANDIFYVYYTSGSTGRPKGVIATQASMLNRFEWMWRQYPFDNDTCCMKTALGFIDAVWEMFGAVLKGFETVIVDQMTLLDLSSFMQLLSEQQITRLVVVPSLLNAMMEFSEEFDKCLRHLKYLTVSGEHLTDATLTRFHQFGANTVLLNLYGSSEIAADVTCFESVAGVASHIGYPIDNMQCYVLDRQLVLVPDGVVGNLYVSGPGLAQGYYNLPELTAERFIHNPFSDHVQHQVLFKTGDLVRRDHSGLLSYLGRQDDQIKIRGMRVELGDIENQIAQFDGVSGCVALLKDVGGTDCIVCYVEIPTNDINSNLSEDITKYAAAYLPSYMVPAHVICMQVLPKLYNGKVNKRALIDMPICVIVNENHSFTDWERRLASMWANLLNVPIQSVRPHSTFFSLGGNSLKLTKLIRLIESEFGVLISLKIIFDLPSLRELSGEIELLHIRNCAQKQISLSDNTVEMEF